MAKYPTEMRLPRKRYIMQLHNAKQRGIAWEFTFDQWWKIWQDSGRWEQRGWGAEKYCMCRFGDRGPYAVGNVYIATNTENMQSIDWSRTKVCKPGSNVSSRKLLPVGVRTQKGKFYATRTFKGTSYHIGTFPTPELARAAYENFTV